MTDTAPLASPIGPAKALVLITRTTTCDCGERFSSPELYERHQPSGHWSLRNILHLRRLHVLPEHRLPIERHAVAERIPFCDYCLALGSPMAHLPVPPDPRATLGGLYKAPTPEPPAKQAPARRTAAPPLSLDDIFGATP